MSGWVTVAAIALVLLVIAGFAVRAFARRWWDYPLTALFTVLLFPVLANSITGDISRYVPLSAFDEGGYGKDQIVIASILSTVLVGVILSAGAIGLVRWGWQRLRR